MGKALDHSYSSRTSHKRDFQEDKIISVSYKNMTSTVKGEVRRNAGFPCMIFWFSSQNAQACFSSVSLNVHFRLIKHLQILLDCIMNIAASLRHISFLQAAWAEDFFLACQEQSSPSSLATVPLPEAIYLSKCRNARKALRKFAFILLVIYALLIETNIASKLE